MENRKCIKVLFQGDSITDCGRDRSDPSALGNGYVSIISDFFHANRADMPVETINRGISGNRTIDLVKRWKEDFEDIRPDWLSLLVGVNDCWRRYDRGDPTPLEDFEIRYRFLLGKAYGLVERIIILEPFFLPVRKDFERWIEDLGPKVQVIRRLSREYKATYIPLDGLFTEATMKHPLSFFTRDGIHPTYEGHQFIAQSWLKSIVSFI
jgi:lysophospholipase L1-like esterase